MTATPIRVLIADDQALVRSGLALVIGSEPDMQVAGEAADGREALARCRELQPDIALLDIRMPGLDGLEVARRLIRDPADDPIAMLTTFDLDSYLYEALKIGVSGFFLKDDPPEQIIAGIRAVVAGAALLSPSLTQRVVALYVRGPAPDAVATELEQLTAREREVLCLIARGLSNTEIADELVLAETTVKTHIGHIFGKLGLRDRAQAGRTGLREGAHQPRPTHLTHDALPHVCQHRQRPFAPAYRAEPALIPRRRASVGLTRAGTGSVPCPTAGGARPRSGWSRRRCSGSGH